MLCSNCGKNEANVHYTHIVNGNKTEYNLCDECAKKLGIDNIDFNMPINFSNFLSDFFEDEAMLPSFTGSKINKCSKCGLTYEEFAKTGKFGCGECYEAFSNKIDAVLKNLHGSSKHRGRAPQNQLNKADIKEEQKNLKNKIEEQVDVKEAQSNSKNKAEEQIDEKQDKLNKLNEEIKVAIKEERYEDAAKIRDEIKKLQ